MTPTSPGEQMRTPRRAWMIVTVLAGLLAVGNAIGVIVLLVNTRWLEALLGLLSVPAAYWFSMGAWRRTPWGQATSENAPPDPPVLSPRRARTYAWIGAACVGELVVALALQVFVLSR